MNKTYRVNLWLQGWGVPAETITKILEDKRLKYELSEETPDGLGVMQALKSAMYPKGDECREAIEAIGKPMEKILFLSMFD